MTSARHYYAAWWPYGMGTLDGATGRDYIGGIEVFDVAEERDAWVDDDVWDGDYHRSAYPARDAVPIMAREVCEQDGRCYSDYRYLHTVDDIVADYRALQREGWC